MTHFQACLVTACWFCQNDGFDRWQKSLFCSNSSLPNIHLLEKCHVARTHWAGKEGRKLPSCKSDLKTDAQKSPNLGEVVPHLIDAAVQAGCTSSSCAPNTVWATLTGSEILVHTGAQLEFYEVFLPCIKVTYIIICPEQHLVKFSLITWLSVITWLSLRVSVDKAPWAGWVPSEKLQRFAQPVPGLLEHEKDDNW